MPNCMDYRVYLQSFLVQKMTAVGRDGEGFKSHTTAGAMLRNHMYRQGFVRGGIMYLQIISKGLKILLCGK